MGKILSIVIGTVVALVGLILLIKWWYEFLFLLKGSIPAFLIFSGIIALIAGVSELKDTLKQKKEESK